MSIFSGLNKEQAEAVNCLEGPLLIMAGAGSGKTRVLTYRIANLLEHGVAPYSILAITFTNKAAAEMKERVYNMIGESAKSIMLSTFHSFCAKFLRREIESTGIYKNNFVIYDTSDSQTVVKKCLKELNLDEKQYTPAGIRNVISNAKNEMLGPSAFAVQTYDFYKKKVAEVYQLYQKKLQENNALDFDDLLLLTVTILEENSEIREKYQRRYKYIMVDEYQDTNGAQYKLTKLLADGYHNLCVVGDADQSIYGWRGADITNIMNFERDNPSARVIMLEQNYRSSQIILEAANAVIEHNDNRKPKNLWTANPHGDKITTYLAIDEQDEADFIADTIIKQQEIYGTSCNDIAILYRTNAQSRILEKRFKERDIKYNIVGSLSFYDRKEIKDIIAYLRLIYNPLDTVSLLRIINVPKRGIGEGTINKLGEFAIENNCSIFEVLATSELLENVPGLTARSKKPLIIFIEMIFSLMERLEKLALSDFIEEVIKESGYIEALQAENKIENEERIEHLYEFIGEVKEFEKKEEEEPNLENFLSSMALISDIDESDFSEERVNLMTLHSAKGLEFPVVFMTGMEEGMFPHARTLLEPAELEEERRTCYVGITRAERKLYMTYAEQRTIYNRTNYYEPSRFLEEIPGECKEEIISRRKKRANTFGFGNSFSAPQINFSTRSSSLDMQNTPRPLSGYEILTSLNKEREAVASVSRQEGFAAIKPNMTIEWKAGDKARHNKWGIGTVVSVKGQGEEVQLSIAFPDLGIKQLMQKYAPLEKV